MNEWWIRIIITLPTYKVDAEYCITVQSFKVIVYLNLYQSKIKQNRYFKFFLKLFWLTTLLISFITEVNVLY